jgi:hypothetical protein
VNETANGTCQFWKMQEGHYPELSVLAGAIPPEPNGLGTLEDPYRITDANELGTLWYRPWARYRLQADIDLTGVTWSAAVVPYFYGSLDGNGHVIRGLHIQGVEYLGLLGFVTSDASLIDVALESVEVKGTSGCIGGLAGENRGNATSSYSVGSVCCTGPASGGDYCVGGLIGLNRGVIASSHTTGDVKGTRTGVVGGLVGISTGSISMSYSVSTVSASSFAGGLVAVNTGTINSSYSTGPASGDNYVGGLASTNTGSILTSYSVSTASGNDSVGGLVGQNVGTIESSYSRGGVNGHSHVGGLVGYNSRMGGISACFWDTQTSGLNRSSGGSGLPTAEMKRVKTFLDAGWDFVGETANGSVDVWWIDEGRDYPKLWWEARE